MLEGAKTGKQTKGKTKQFEKDGGYPEGLKDFEKLGVKKVHDIPTGKTGTLANGNKVNVRRESSAKCSTLEIIKNNGRRIKIRYRG